MTKILPWPFFFPSYYLWFQFRFLLHLGIFLTPRHVRNNIPLAFLFIATQEKLRATVIAIDAILFNIVEWFNVFFCFSFVFSWNLHGNFFCWVSLVLISGHVSWLEISNHRKLYTKLYYAVIKTLLTVLKTNEEASEQCNRIQVIKKYNISILACYNTDIDS